MHSAKVFGAPIDQGRLRPSHRVRAVVGVVQVQGQVVNPMLEDYRVLPGSEMGLIMEPAGNYEGFRLQPAVGAPTGLDGECSYCQRGRAFLASFASM